MKTTPEQIENWLRSSSEHQRLEFKEAKTQFSSQKLFEYCVALANEGGGNLVLGVSDRIPRRVVGTNAIDDPVGMAEKLFQVLRFRVDIEELRHPDGRVLIFHIPSRPKGTAYHHDGRYLMRSGATLTAMSEDHLRGIFAEGKPDWLEGYTKIGLDAQQVVNLLDTQGFFDLLELPYPTSRQGVIERLLLEHVVDERDGLFSIKGGGRLAPPAMR